jgi:MYXO-CTERM domain-containing protein
MHDRRSCLFTAGAAALLLTPVLGGATTLGCRGASADELVGTNAQPIQGGTVDQTDAAVVTILINSSQGMSLCSGALVGPNLVLSAHHCVADSLSTACGASGFSATYPAGDFRVTTSYDAAASVFNGGGTNLPAADGVTWFAVSAVGVPGNNICGQDLAALTLSSAVSGVCPLIPAVDTGPTDGETYTAIGSGITAPSGTTAGTRYKATGLAVQCVGSADCQDSTISATAEWIGGSPQSKGTCEGDSGGPAIDALGRVIGSVSRGPSNACNQTTYESYYGESAWIKTVATAAATAGGYAPAGWVTGAATSSAASGYCPPATPGDAGGTADASVDGAATADTGAASDAAGDAEGPTDAGGTADVGSSDAEMSDAGAPDADAATSEEGGSSDAGSVATADAASGDASGSVGADAGSTDAGGAAKADAGSKASDAGSSGSPDGSSAAGTVGQSSGCAVSASTTGRSDGPGLAGLLLGTLALRRRRRTAARRQ